MQTSPPMSPATAIVIFPLFFVTLWCVVCFTLSRISGWALLANRFRADSRRPERTWTWQSARMRWGCNYNRCLNFGADPSGLYLSIMFLFRIGSPSLLVPWPEITVWKRRSFLFFRFRASTRPRRASSPPDTGKVGGISPIRRRIELACRTRFLGRVRAGFYLRSELVSSAKFG